MRQQDFDHFVSGPSPWRRGEVNVNHQLDEICRWIDEHSRENITWDDLTRASGLDHRLLLKLFQIHKKTTPMAYLRQCRQAATI